MNLNQAPPSIIQKLFKWFCPDHLHEEIEGDLYEWFLRDIDQKSTTRARLNYAWNALWFLRPAIVRRKKSMVKNTNQLMNFHFLTTAIRHIKSQRSTSLINALGLSIGLCSSLLILSIIRYEESFDQFHTDADRIYRVVRVSQVEGEEEYRTGVAYPLPVAIENEMPVVEESTSIVYWDWEDNQISIPNKTTNINTNYIESNGLVFVDDHFFNLFDFNGTNFHWESGDPETALEAPFKIVLTESWATKYFGEENPMGKTVIVNGDMNFQVSGVIKDFPNNTDFPFHGLMSYATLMEFVGDGINNWWSISSNELYVRIGSEITPGEVDKQLDALHAAHTPTKLHEARKYRLQQLSEVHEDVRFGNFNDRVVSKDKKRTLIYIGLFLLVAACINYINLATARATLRARETGVRKVLGSTRQQLIFQFMSEAFFITLMSGVIAVFMAEFIAITFHELLGTPDIGFLIQDTFVLQTFVGIIFVLATLSGAYPALVISGFNPLSIMRSKASTSAGNFLLRRLLVVFQFSLTMIFIIGTVIVMKQIDFFKQVDLGFEKEAILTINLPESEVQNYQILANQWQENPRIAEVSFSNTMPSGVKRPFSFWDIRKEGEEEAFVTEMQFIDEAYLSLYGISILGGRNLRLADSSRGIIINKTLMEKNGFESPEQALGKRMKLGKKVYSIVGIVDDFHSKSLRDEIDKITFGIQPDRYSIASIKLVIPENGISQESLSNTLEDLESKWKSVFPNDAMAYHFFDENIAAFYSEETRFSQLLQVFSYVLIIIGGLGLYGLISFVVNRRMNEVAIRKTFGATFSNILILITHDFTKLLGMSFVIAVPIAYYFLQGWLSNFMFRIEITWWLMVLPALAVFLMAFLVVGGQSLKAARLNPADILRNE